MAWAVYTCTFGSGHKIPGYAQGQRLLPMASLICWLLDNFDCRYTACLKFHSATQRFKAIKEINAVSKEQCNLIKCPSVQSFVREVAIDL